ncbi:fam-l protein [Plasmodium brasilianum]|uniref:Fam-l protein n=1 Tax=Plasmodium brasilianum TaxID=5824 RepID=A0ACB9YAV6_PLABR|nr:fam-l protein [Plasmodium brasilianum]
MEQKIMFLFIKISTFMLLPWMCHFYNYMSHFNKNSNKKYDIHRKLITRNYRLLTEYDQDKNSCVAYIKEEMPNNKMKKKKYISNNNKGTNGKHKHSCRCSLYNEEYGKNVEKNNIGVPKTKKYFDFEKKIFKELEYENYLKNIKTIEHKEYKKMAHKKRRILIALFLLFILVLILPILDLSLEKFRGGGLLGLLNLVYPKTSTGGAVSTDLEGVLATSLSADGWNSIKIMFISPILIYCIPFLIFVVIFILGMVYYYKKVIKYENAKFRK